MSSGLQLDVHFHIQWRRHLVNAYEVKAGMVFFAGLTVWSMPERCKVVCIPCKVLYTCSAVLLTYVWRTCLSDEGGDIVDKAERHRASSTDGWDETTHRWTRASGTAASTLGDFIMLYIMHRRATFNRKHSPGGATTHLGIANEEVTRQLQVMVQAMESSPNHYATNKRID